MLTDFDFARLISDPRLGTVKTFFKPAQCQESYLIPDGPKRNESKLYDWTVTDVCHDYETSSESERLSVTITKTAVWTKKTKSKRCNQCANCKAKDCGKCIQCLDKPKFGGRGIPVSYAHLTLPTICSV